MATCDVALIREQGVRFAVVCVADHVIDSPHQRENALAAWASELGVPIALMGARRHRTFGRPDIVRWLANINPGCLPWRRATIS